MRQSGIKKGTKLKTDEQKFSKHIVFATTPFVYSELEKIRKIAKKPMSRLIRDEIISFYDK